MTPKLGILALTAVLLSGSALAQEGSVVVYNPAGDAGELIIDGFQAKYPGVSVSTINAGVGELFTRMSAEKNNPQGDIILCASSEAFMANPDLFASYESTEIANFSADVIGPDNTYYGCSMPLQAFIVNTNLLAEDEYPTSWEDLSDPRFAGKLVLANPSLSGSAYAQLAQILQLYGWDVAEGIMANARFTTSSQSVFQDVGRGEIEIGVTGEANIGPMVDEGYPVTAVYPSDGTGLRFDASAIIDGARNLDNAKLFLDYANSAEAHELLVSTNRRSVRADIAAPDGLAPTSEIVTFTYDADAAAENRDEALAHWEELFAQ
ncbi:MAG TPA: extracellular solute-binding protein [Pelagibacterium sp.]|uniref:extracellular solute-binding protein n=1 Tax=Pelagibacterium sp. TaxID=1967288 RepID=UPI002B730F9F|nr:extracellular solute-binding protein [Pelagibacterium sp.]HWJ86837.1 extracellular solute-binding protein [Pelagibacterium sp.]